MNNGREEREQGNSRRPPFPGEPSKRRQAPFALDGPDAAEVMKLLNDVRQAGLAAGIRRDDPMHPVLECMSRTILFLENLSVRSNRTVTEASQRVVDAIAHARTTADVELQRFEKGAAEARARTIADVSQAIAESAEAALTKRVGILQWRTILCVAGLLVAVIITSLWGGYKWGSRSMQSQLEQKRDELNAFSRLNPDDAHRWAGLMLFNSNIKPEFDKCADRSFPLDGRKACNFSFWIE